MKDLIKADIIEYIKTRDLIKFFHDYDDYDDKPSNKELKDLKKLKTYALVHKVHGGDGEGNLVERVYYFKEWNTYLAFTGYYSSYRGVQWNEDYIYEVKPVDRIVTIYTQDLNASEELIKIDKHNIEII